jgi:hypothetical protein
VYRADDLHLRWGFAIALALLLSFNTSSGGAAPGEELGARAPSVIDRTFRCTPVALGDGVRDLEVIAHPLGSHEFQNPSPSPGFLSLGSGGLSPTSELVSVRAAAWERFRQRRVLEGVYVNASRCSAARATLRLSRTGLPGRPVQWSENKSCPVTGRVLVRVRAVLQAPARWQQLDRTYVGARRSVVEAAFAVRSERSRKPIAFVELGRAGKTRLWTSSDCS